MCLQRINRLNYQNKNSFPEQLIILFNKSITADKNNGSKYGNFYKKKLRQKSYNPNLAWKTNKISVNSSRSLFTTKIVFSVFSWLCGPSLQRPRVLCFWELRLQEGLEGRDLRRGGRRGEAVSARLQRPRLLGHWGRPVPVSRGLQGRVMRHRWVWWWPFRAGVILTSWYRAVWPGLWRARPLRGGAVCVRPGLVWGHVWGADLWPPVLSTRWVTRDWTRDRGVTMLCYRNVQ